MRKIIHSKFELDLTPYKITEIEKNAAFSDSLFSKVTYPFQIDLTDQVNLQFDFIKDYTTRSETVYDVVHSHNDKLEFAKLYIEEIVDDKLQVVLEIGMEQFPSWEKNLSDLSLEKFELPDGVTIYDHAETIITQSWPDVNYNFPQIHTDKIDTEEDESWFAFERIINNRKDGAFLENDVDLVEEEVYNRNIMQPLVHPLHILQRGVIDAGFTLAGEILNEPRLQKKYLYGDVEYYNAINQESTSIILMSEDRDEMGTIEVPNSFYSSSYYDYEKFTKVYPISNPGKYRIVGNLYVYPIFNTAFTKVKIKYRNQTLYSKSSFNFIGVATKWRLKINLIFETLVDLEPNDITVEIFHKKTNEKIIVQLDINPIRLHDATGNAIANIINVNEIDLPKAVPSMTFGEFVKIIKNWLNYNFILKDNVVYMDKIKINTLPSDIISLEEFEVKKPQRIFKKRMSFLLKFAEYDKKEYTFKEVYQDFDGISTEGFITDDETNTIEINALPLPLLLRNEVQTAYAFETNSSKAYFVHYDGLVDGKNLSQDCSDLLLQEVHTDHWLDWMNFRIKSIDFKWSFIAHYMKILYLKSFSAVYCYQNNHIVTQLTKTEISPDVYQIEIETASL